MGERKRDSGNIQDVTKRAFQASDMDYTSLRFDKTPDIRELTFKFSFYLWKFNRNISGEIKDTVNL